MGRLTELLDSLLALLGVHLEPWMGSVIGVVIVLILFPFLKRSHRTSKVRKRMLRLKMVSAQEREALEQEILELVGDDPAILLVVADESVRQGRFSFARVATSRLEATGKKRDQLKAIKKILDAPPTPTVAQERLAIESLIEERLYKEALRRVEAARRHWPSVQDWDELEELVPEMSEYSLRESPTNR